MTLRLVSRQVMLCGSELSGKPFAGVPVGLAHNAAVSGHLVLCAGGLVRTVQGFPWGDSTTRLSRAPALAGVGRHPQVSVGA